jgi:hypothetical protein
MERQEVDDEEGEIMDLHGGVKQRDIEICTR